MALATGGSAVGAIRMRSRPSSCALRIAAEVCMISTEPSGKTARTSRARIASLTFSRILGRRGGKPLGFIERQNHQQARAFSYDQIVADLTCKAGDAIIVSEWGSAAVGATPVGGGRHEHRRAHWRL